MDYKIGLEIVKNIECKGKKVGDYYYDEETDTLSFSLPYPFPCKFAVVGLEKIIVTPMMLRLPTFLKYHNIDWLRQQLFQIKLIKDDKLLLHGSAWKLDGEGYLAVGFPDSGKTTSALFAVERSNAEFCADENVIINMRMDMIPVYRKTSLSYWLAKQIKYPLSIKQRLQYLVACTKHKLCPLFEPNIWVDLPYARHWFKLDKLIYLNEGKGRSLLLLTDNEFPFYVNPVIQTYAYASGWDIESIYGKYKKLIKEVEKCCQF